MRETDAALARVAMSASSSQTACAASDRPFQTPSDRGTAPATVPWASWTIFDLVARLGQVDEQRHAVRVGERARRLSVGPSSVYGACGATAGVTSASSSTSR